ncbi:Carboxypeptidase N subunit 2 [Folsomia candida]|uniref:Carboxypeptidase N subunit 2 n=1 Tax=Folsomia candida TaxID=158441 RepID=A0A226F1T9_FOLCA|nr:Carboxypeptidase N subunit 2 [Folsomia candida]
MTTQTNMKQRMTWKNSGRVLNLLLHVLTALVGVASSTHEDCPWYRKDERLPDQIKANCICATNPSSDNQLSIQCHDIHAETLVSILVQFHAGTKQPLELLYLNGSRVTNADGMLLPSLFRDLKIVSLQLSGCKISSVHKDSFSGSEEHLKHLSLSQNELSSVPSEALGNLNRLSLLDLSYNKITRVAQGSFSKLNKLATLKLHDNNLELHPASFIGLERSHIPEAIYNLSSLAFLDLAQNRLRELEPYHFVGLHSLTALNLERNLLQSLPESVFEGINDTLSSLSLLNNLITNFPRSALKNLHELRVLDLGFNLLTEVPRDAFQGLKSLTLLALDGNPLATLSETSFAPLNTTLRGISLGGRFLNCDCRLQWVLEWVQTYDLQVTSRERNPQFCGSPTSLRSLNFYQIQPEDLACPKNETIKNDYDVNLSPEDMALLGMGSSSVYASSTNKEEGGGSSSALEDSSEQETEENRTTFTLEAPVPPVTQQERNGSVSKFKPRRPRPITKFTKAISSTTPSTTSTTPEEISKHDSGSGEENNSKKQVSSLETDFVGLNISNIAKQSPIKKIINNERLSSQIRQNGSTTPPPLILTTTTTSTHFTTHKTPVRNPPIRPNSVRHRITPKTVPTTTTITTTTMSTSSKTLPPEYDNNSQYQTTSSSSSTTTTTSSTISPGSPQRPHTSKTTIIDAAEIDDSKIPVISGIGSAVSSPNLHTGSIMSVKQPLPVQTHNQNVNVLPKSMLETHHQGGNRLPPPHPNLIFADKSEIVVQEIVRNGDSVTLHWESSKQAVGFRIIYRLFGEDSFRHGPPLASTETEYRIKNIPNNECMVVCVVPYEEILYNEISPSAASVPPGSQCREVKPTSPSALMNHMDKITIGASAAICVTVLIAVLIFIGITRRAKSKQRPPSTSTLLAKLPPTSFMTPTPGPNMVQTSGGAYGMAKDWDAMSVVSTKSIPRARMYHGSMDGLANPSMKTATLNPHFTRGGPDGLSTTHRSFSAAHHHHHSNNIGHHNHGYHHQHRQVGNVHTHGSAASAVNNYLNNQNRLLRTSLGSRASYDALNKLATIRHSHHQFEHNRRKRSSRLNQSESLNTLNGYETPDNWTDHDHDHEFYVARNHTRHDLVQL